MPEYVIESVLDEDEYVVLSRAHDRCGRSVLIEALKTTPPSPAEYELLRQELEATRLVGSDIAPEAQRIATLGERPVLIFHDDGGEPLARRMREPMELDRFLPLAIRLAEVLATVHGRQVLHLALAPHHVMVMPGGEVKLSAFGQAVIEPTSLRAQPARGSPRMWPYLSPEQIGRLGLVVDHRSDLYSLGVLYYQLLTGRLPYVADDLLGWRHCHCAITPPSPLAYLPDLPPPIADIVLMLLAKIPEDRYQSAAGLRHDLARCLEAWRVQAKIAPFPLGQADTPPPLRMSARTYGRDDCIARLKDALARTGGDGQAEVVLVSGPPGIGKTTLVRDLLRGIGESGALVGTGKCDAVERDRPYGVLIQALEEVFVQALAESGDEHAALHHRLASGLGVNAPLVAGMLPVLTRILGPQGPPPELPLREAEHRILRAFSQLMCALARPRMPLVLFLDDLQWADAGTLEVIAHWATHPEVRHTLLIGAFRNTEVSASHPVRRMTDRVRQHRGSLHERALTPLSAEAVTRWVADSLRRAPDEVAPLSALVHARTGGNPFFIGQLVSSLYREGLIHFSNGDRAWRWDLPRIQAQRYSDDVAELIAANIRDLAPATQDALRRFACHGGTVDLPTLSIILGCPEPTVIERLQEAFAARLIARVDGQLCFLHDRIQQVADALTPPEQGPETHLSIGRALLASTAPDRLGACIFDIVRHIHAGRSRITSREERARAAALELMAGQKAQAATSHDTAIGFLRAGLDLLGSEGWETHHAIAFGLTFALAQCRFVTGDLAAAEDLCGILLARARTSIEAAAVHALLADVQVTQGAMTAALDSCLQGLRRFGIDLHAHPSDAEVDAACTATLARLEGRSVASLADLPPMTDPDARAACDLVAALHAPAAYVRDWNLFAVATCAAVDLSLSHGNASSSAPAYATLGYCLAGRYQRYEDAFAFGDVAYRLAQREELLAHRARAGFEFAAFLSYLALPVRECLDLLQRELEVAVAVGDQTFACSFAYHVTDFRLFAGDQLDEVAEEAARRGAFAERAGFKLVQDGISAQGRLIACLRGATGVDAFADAASEDHLEKHQIAMGRFMYHVNKLQARVLLGDLEGAILAAQRARPLVQSASGFLRVADYHFYAALALAARWRPGPPPDAPACLDTLYAHRDHIQGLAASCPANFGPHVALIAAEIARLSGEALVAERAYEQAIHEARAAGFLHVVGIAGELAARFYRQRGFDTIADAYLAQACDCYEAWGARAKVEALRRQHPQLGQRAVTGTGAGDSLDVLGILKASQAITSALLLPDLHARLLAVTIEHAGAQRGCLLLVAAQDLILAAAGGADAGSFGPIGQAAAPARLPLWLCRSVLHSHKPMVLADAAASHRFMADPYFRAALDTRRSILCLPIVRQDQVVGLLYLENNLIPGAFDGTRVGVLDVLASQAAISLDNARLYTELQQENADRRRAEAFLRESKMLLQSIIDNTTAVIFVKDAEGRYLLVNRRFEEVFHLRREEVLGKTVHDLFAREQADVLWASDWSVIEDDRAIELDESVALDDGVHEYLCIKFPLRDTEGRPYAICGIATDVTARKRAAEALRHSHSLLEATLESTADGLLVVDRGGRIVQLNRRFVDMWGIPEQLLVQRDDCKALAFVLDRLEEPEDFLRKVEALYRQPEQSSFDILRFKDGRILERYSQPQYLGGQVVGRVWSFRDVTSRVRAEAQRDRLLADEKRARAEAEEAVRQRDEFLSVASHELRTPLTSLQLAIQGLDEDLLVEGMDVARARWVVALARRQVKRLGSLVGLLLDVARIQAGRLAPNPSEVDLRQIVAEIAAQLADELARAGCVLTVQPGPPVIGWWDIQQMEQVVTNLLANAIKFGKGKPIEMAMTTDRERARLLVTDHGIGIPLDIQSHIFERFGRGVSARHYGGLGLGLYITRTIVEAHGGRVHVRSEPGQGATFTVELPLSRHAVPAQQV